MSRPRRRAPSIPGAWLRIAAVVASCWLLGTCSNDDPVVPVPTPTLTGLAPATGVPGATVAVTVTGANLVVGATTVAVAGSGITVANVNASSATSLTASFVISPGATLGPRDVAVTTAGGTSGSQPFTIIPPPPTLTSVNPATGAQGTTVSVALVGTNFVADATTVAVSGGAVTVTRVSVISPTSLTADFVITASATPGARSVTVTTGGGTSGPQPFSVGLPAPTLIGIVPATGVVGTTIAVTLTGTHFVAGATTVAVSGTGVTVSNVNVTGATSLTANIAIAIDATPGARSVTVATAGGTTGAQTFTVSSAVPTLASVTPNTGAQGGTRTVTLTGSGFVVGGTTVAVSGGNVIVNNVNVSGTTTLTADFVTAAGAAVGAREVRVTTAAGTSGPQAFTVLAAPSLNDFDALPTHLTVVQPTRLAWSTSNATSCSIDNGVGVVACSGTVTVTPGANTTYTLTASNAGASIAASVSVLVAQPARFLYSTAAGDNQVRMFAINGTTGDLTALGGATIPAGTSPVGIVVHPTGLYAYAVNSATDNVSMYTVNAATGALATNGTIAAGNDPGAIAVDPTGRYAYVANQNLSGDSGTVSVYRIDDSGRLVSNGPAMDVDSVPVTIAIDALGKYVYVAEAIGDITMFAINVDGTLTRLGSTGIGRGFGVGADPRGRFVFATTAHLTWVLTFAILPDGQLNGAPSVTATGTMTDITVEATGRYVYALDSTNSLIHAFGINLITGELTSLGSWATGATPSRLATDPQGKFVYVANQVGTISIYRINPSTGTLTLVNTVAAGAQPRGIAVSR